MPRKKKDPTAPKRPLSAYMFFAKERRPAMREENKDIKFGDYSKIIATEWKELTDEDRQPYDEQAKKDKARYEREKVDYAERKKNEPPEIDTEPQQSIPYPSSATPNYSNANFTANVNNVNSPGKGTGLNGVSNMPGNYLNNLGGMYYNNYPANSPGQYGSSNTAYTMQQMQGMQGYGGYTGYGGYNVGSMTPVQGQGQGQGQAVGVSGNMSTVSENSAQTHKNFTTQQHIEHHQMLQRQKQMQKQSDQYYLQQQAQHNSYNANNNVNTLNNFNNMALNNFGVGYSSTPGSNNVSSNRYASNFYGGYGTNYSSEFNNGNYGSNFTATESTLNQPQNYGNAVSNQPRKMYQYVTGPQVGGMNPADDFSNYLTPMSSVRNARVNTNYGSATPGLGNNALRQAPVQREPNVPNGPSNADAKMEVKRGSINDTNQNAGNGNEETANRLDGHDGN